MLQNYDEHVSKCDTGKKKVKKNGKAANKEAKFLIFDNPTFLISGMYFV